MTYKKFFDDLDISDEDRDKYDSFDLMMLAWNTARRTDPIKKQMLEALENIENDDNSIPYHAWQMIKSAIKAAEEKQE